MIFIGGSVTGGASVEGTPMKRYVLAVWSSEMDQKVDSSTIHLNIAHVFNHLGIQLDYVDLDEEKLPDPKAKVFQDKYLGVVTAFDVEELPAAWTWINWLGQLAQTPIPWVAFRHLGFLKKKDVGDDDKKEIIEKLGLKFIKLDREILFSKLRFKAPNVFGFERDLVIPYVDIPPVSANQSLLEFTVANAKMPLSAVFISKKWSLAYGNHGLYSNRDGRRKQWVLNPYDFVTKALHLDRSVPVPDVNLLNGRRLFMSHIDGDAAHSISEVDKTKYTSQMIKDKILRRYSELPIGVSFIVAELHRKFLGSEDLEKIGHEIFQLPNVEPASHTYFHPLYWTEDDLSYPLEKMSLEKETLGSIDELTKKLKPKRPLRVLYWSGDCRPPEQALKLLDSKGYLNMNGGDSRFDSMNPSRAFLSGLGIPRGNYFQVYAPNANEIIYTDGWKRNHFAFSQVVETFERTAAPVLLKPVNPYYHFYSADRPMALKAVSDLYEWALKQEISPVFPSTYIEGVLAHRNLKMEKTSVGFKGHDAEGLFTLRVDAPLTKKIDIQKSQGVMGYRNFQGSLYIYLDPAYLQKSKGQFSVAFTVLSDEVPPYLSSVGGTAMSFQQTSKTLELTLGVFVRPPLVIASMKNKPRSVRLNGKETPFEWKNSELSISFPISTEKIQVVVQK